MKVRYKEEPGSWRLSTLLTLLGLALFSSLLRWRQVLVSRSWLMVLAGLATVAILAVARPHWFRRYYRFSTWAGFWSSQWLARFLLMFIFLVIIVPAGLLMRLTGKDSLRLKRKPGSYWNTAKPTNSLDRLF